MGSCPVATIDFLKETMIEEFGRLHSTELPLLTQVCGAEMAANEVHLMPII